MEGEEGGGIRLSKRFNDNKDGSEVDYKTKAGTAWSHSYLNQKPWHPLSYPNQRRKWIAEQTHAQRQRRAEEVSREYAQEQEFFRQTALISKKEKEKIEMMKAVSFMYVRPPGYNAESAKAAEIADERKKDEMGNTAQHPPDEGASTMHLASIPSRDPVGEEKKKPRPKDVFGRPVPTEEEFEVLKNAPRMETGVPARVKPFGIEVRNVKCIRCGNYGHQSGDRECPLKDAIMPNEESRLKRDDPLTAIMAHTDPTEPLKWELKQKPGMSPPRGGFNPDDPNQQIVAEDIFDEYGGFLGGDIPQLLTNISPKKSKKKSKKHKHKRDSSPSRECRAPEESGLSSPVDDRERRSKSKMKKKLHHAESSSFEDLNFGGHCKKSKHKYSISSENSDGDRHHRSKRSRYKHSYSSEDSGEDRHQKSKRSSHKHSYSSEDSGEDRHQKSKRSSHKHSYSSEDSGEDRHQRSKRSSHKHSYSSEDSGEDRHQRSKRSSHKHSYSSEDSDSDRHHKSKKKRQKHSNLSEESDSNGHHRSKNSRMKHRSSFEHSPFDRHQKSEKKQMQSYQNSYNNSDFDGQRKSKRHPHRHHH